MDFFGEVFGKFSAFLATLQGPSPRTASLAGSAAGTSASLFEGLNRVVGDGLSGREWFATKESDEAPVKLPWEASLPEELPYERLDVNASARRFWTASCIQHCGSCDGCS